MLYVRELLQQHVWQTTLWKDENTPGGRSFWNILINKGAAHIIANVLFQGTEEKPKLRVESCWVKLIQYKARQLENNMTKTCFDIVLQGSAHYPLLFCRHTAVFTFRYLLVPACGYKRCELMFWYRCRMGLALWGQSQPYWHSRRLCNGRFDGDTVFPDKGISIQKHLWRASRESFTEDELVSVGRGGGRKQGEEGIWLCYRRMRMEVDEIPRVYPHKQPLGADLHLLYHILTILEIKLLYLQNSLCSLFEPDIKPFSQN